MHASESYQARPKRRASRSLAQASSTQARALKIGTPKLTAPTGALHFTGQTWLTMEQCLRERAQTAAVSIATCEDDRRCFEAVLWVLWHAAPWNRLPKRYGSKSTIQRRLTRWAETGVLFDLWRAFLDQLDQTGLARWDECFIDGVFNTGRDGVNWEGRLRRAREASNWYHPMARVLRLEYIWQGADARDRQAERK